jgi:hypothetical protein
MRRVAIAALFLAGCPQPDPATCGGFCGEGTVCLNAKCAVAEVLPDEEELEEDDTGKKKRRRRRGRRGAGDDGAEAGEKFVPVNDSAVPRYGNNRGQTISEDGGTERLSNRKVQQHMGTLEGRFNKCIATAAQLAPDDLGRGRISFDLNVEPSGKVSGVSVQAPKNLKVFGIIPCIRVAVHNSRFPTWDGPSMRVEYSFQVE